MKKATSLKSTDNGFPLEPIMEEIDVCPLCDSGKAKFLFWNFDRLYSFGGKFGTWQCEECRLIRLSPRPVKEQLSAYYPSDYYSYQTSTYFTDGNTDRSLKSRLRSTVRNTVLSGMGYPETKVAGLQKFLRPVFSKLFKKPATYGFGDKFPLYVPNGSALEVGCGSASYLSLLKRHGWNVVGVDLSPQAASEAKKHFDIDVFVGELEEAPFVESSFDYIRMSHVVEHFTNPLQGLKKIREILKPGGVAYIEVPNAESFESRKSGEFWYGWDAPRHLFMFSPYSFRKLVEAAGLRIERILTEEWSSFWWNNTYELEEKLGELLDQRPYYSRRSLPLYLKSRIASKVNYLFKPTSGYNICCWVSRNN